MKVRQKGLVLMVTVLLFAGVAYAAEEEKVIYNYRVAEDNTVWVDVENDSDTVIKVISVVVSFYDENENLMEKSELNCEKDCLVDEDQAKSFGPINGPGGWEVVRVTKVYYEPVNE